MPLRYSRRESTRTAAAEVGEIFSPRLEQVAADCVLAAEEVAAESPDEAEA